MAKQGQPRGYTIGDDARREISDMLAWFKRHNGGGGNLPTEPFTKFGPRTFRWAKTQANSLCETYPIRPANTFPIILGELQYDDTSCGQKARAFVPYDPQEDRIANDFHDQYWPSGSIVPIFHAHGRWYIFDWQPMFAEGKFVHDVCGDEEGITVTETKLFPGCGVAPFQDATNPRKHAGPAQSKALFIHKQCEDGTDEWQVFDVELRKYCSVVGIEDRPSCLVAAGLQTQGEWCPAGEPVTACNVVPYTDCDVTLPSCDQAWVFTPLYACCGQAGSASPSPGKTALPPGGGGPGDSPGGGAPGYPMFP